MNPLGPKPDGGAIDPRIARILLAHREAVAQATEKAYRELRAAGVRDAGPLLGVPPRQDA